MHANRLDRESSPYLQQHAANPVHWQPWDAAALALAVQTGKPILLSIGYSACHWCHVMAHESFEDETTAAVMNELFVNIKVDREERPDLDRIYQTAQQLLTQRPGGWPLTMFLCPGTQQPFFGGTYFPKERGHGLPAFVDILRRVERYFREHRADIESQGEQLTAALASLDAGSGASEAALDAAPLAACRTSLAASFDRTYGGFGREPKFPHTELIERSLRDWHASSHSQAPDLDSLYRASLTLARMAEGGIYDQVGAGFSRYSVDARWMIPHFEKMLYDNALLLRLYALGALATGEALFTRVCHETADWLLREMAAPGGGFYSSFDADSEGHEGRFYIWTREEIAAHLDAAELTVVTRCLGLEQPANFEGRWHLYVSAPVADAERPVLDAARRRLLAARSTRVWPQRDEKILCAWNALTVRGLAIAARVLQREDLQEAATRTVDFIHSQLHHDGRLRAVYKDGRAPLPAYLDDHAFLLDALLELLQNRWRSSDLTFAQSLAETLLSQFEDRAEGGFYFTAEDHEPLIHRSKSFADDAVPAGNAIAAHALLKLGYLLGETRYLRAAERTLKAAWQRMNEFPQAHASLLTVLEEYLRGLKIVVIRGDATSVAQWSAQLALLYAPGCAIYAIGNEESALPAGLAVKAPGAQTHAYLCQATYCSTPVSSISEVAQFLRAAAPAAPPAP